MLLSILHHHEHILKFLSIISQNYTKNIIFFEFVFILSEYQLN
ncbi:hypothetical protein LEP1GSC020_3384 [Leptospira interrogans serovar Grippotyphosa str. 2006006986]|nr:hypothetical protein LEP1GSC009_0695 [Leptospira interrogans serovar Grippotyphosa str. Andaman]EKP83513.1 hypothetical protein LEP1GSC020_3384 [Leptospira interrogans serovar Grippotyphosa str. 2006006986]